MDVEIPIEYRGQLKWITGLSRGTTCDDVIYALLRHDLGPNQNIDVSTYRMYEQWPTCERTLSGRTKIVKLWRLLLQGQRAHNVSTDVRLVIRQALTNDILFETGSEMSYGTRSRRARRHHMKQSGGGGGNSSGHSKQTPDRLSGLTKSEIYEQYYRKEKRRRDIGYRTTMPQLSTENTNTGNTQEDVHAYMDLIAKQQAQLDLLTRQISDVDARISQYDDVTNYQQQLSAHERRRQSAQDSIQHDDAGTSLFPTIKANDIEAYLHMCESLVELHENIEQTHSKACYLTSMIHEQRTAVMRNAGKHAPVVTNEQQLQSILHTLHDEYQRSVTLFRAQQQELYSLQEDIRICDSEIAEKRDVISNMTHQLSDIDNQCADTSVSTSSPNLYENITSNSLHTQIASPPYATTPPLQERTLSTSDLNKPDSRNNGLIRDAMHKDVVRREINQTNNNSNAANKLPNGYYHQRHHSNPIGNQLGSPAMLANNNTSSARKETELRTKEVRFRSDVTKWLYDVLSEDDTQENGKQVTSMTSQQSDNYKPMTSMTSQQSDNYKPMTSQQNVNNQYFSTRHHQRTSSTTSVQTPHANTIQSWARSLPNNPESISPPAHQRQTSLTAQSTVIPYGTYLPSTDSLLSKHKADDSNSDTGLSSMNSEEDGLISPLETLV